MYESILPLLLAVIFMACLACLYTEGMWGNALRLINVVTAGLLASNYYEPLAAYLESSAPTYKYLWDFVAFWGLFALFMVLLRLVTDRLSRVKVRFLKIADQIGSIVFAVLVGWVVVCFVTMSLHTAPLSRNFMFGGFQHEQRMFWGLAPDRQWLNFLRSVSRGGFCRSATPAQQEQQTYVFDPYGQFRDKYAERRGALEKQVSSTKAIRTSG